MTGENFFQILGGIDSGLVEKASEDLIMWQRSREGISVPAKPRSHKSYLKLATVCAVCAAVMIGVFAVILNVRKNGLGNVIPPINSEQSGEGDSTVTPGNVGDPQIFTRDFDGLVLTVTTDKGAYKIGEPINLTATLENNTGKVVYLWQEGSTVTDKVRLQPNIQNLIEYPINSDRFGFESYSTVRLDKGERIGQNFSFQTYTSYMQWATGVDDAFVDYDKPAAPGVYNGSLQIQTRPDDWENDYTFSLSTYTLDFSVTLIPADADSENPSQTFTKDYDGLVLTIITDKTSYNIGEPIEITAVLENNTGKDITLYYGECGSFGYDGQIVGSSAELMPKIKGLIEYPVRSAVWFCEAITEIPFGKGEKCIQYFTFQTYAGYIDVPSSTGQFKDAVKPDFSKAAQPGAHKGTLWIMTRSEEGITDYPLDFWVTINSNGDDTVPADGSSTHYTEGMLKDYFIYDGVLYTNCKTCSIDWVFEKYELVGFEYALGEVVMTVNGRAEIPSFENSTANVLSDGTKIYEFLDNSELLLAKVGDEYIPYMKMVEG